MGKSLEFLSDGSKKGRNRDFIAHQLCQTGEVVLFYLVQERAAKIYLCRVFCRKGNRSEKGLESHVALAKIMLSEITGYLRFDQTLLCTRLSMPDWSCRDK